MNNHLSSKGIFIWTYVDLPAVFLTKITAKNIYLLKSPLFSTMRTDPIRLPKSTNSKWSRILIAKQQIHNIEFKVARLYFQDEVKIK